MNKVFITLGPDNCIYALFDKASPQNCNVQIVRKDNCDNSF